jgi:hypothetical protein
MRADFCVHTAAEELVTLRVELPPSAARGMVEKQIKGIAERTGAHLHVLRENNAASVVIEGPASKVSHVEKHALFHLPKNCEIAAQSYRKFSV